MKDERKDIATIEDIRLLVDTFYEKVREDRLIGPIFDSIIRDNWPTHLDKMYRFWQTVLLEDLTYSGSPFGAHIHLPLEKPHFERWLSLFSETLRENFKGEKSDEAQWRAEKMAEMFQLKLGYYRNNPNKKPL